MVNSFSAGKGQLVEPPYGSYVDEWQKPVNSNFGLTDALISGTTTIDATTILSSVPYVTLVFDNFDTTPTPWLNPLAGQNIRIAITGSLTFNITVYIPQNYPGLWIIDNQTTGNFSVIIKTTAASSVGIVAPTVGMAVAFCDGTNVRFADAGGSASNGTPPGTILSFAGPNPPVGYLVCDGTAISRTAYAPLYNAIGTYWGSGNGTTTFNLPNLSNMFLRGSGASAVGVYEADTFGSHTHGVSDPGHSHSFNSDVNIGPNPSSFYTPNGVSNYRLAYTNGAGTGISIQNSGSTETRPVNKRVLYVIKT